MYQVLKFCFTSNYPTIGLRRTLLYLTCKYCTKQDLVEVKKILGIVIKVKRRCKGKCLGSVMATIYICRINTYAWQLRRETA